MSSYQLISNEIGHRLLKYVESKYENIINITENRKHY